MLLVLLAMLTALPQSALAQQPAPAQSEDEEIKALVQQAENPFPGMSPLPSLQMFRKGQLASAEKFLNHPIIKGLSNLAADPGFIRNVEELQKSADTRTLIISEIAWVLLIVILRAKLAARPAHWMRRIWTRLWTMLLLVGGCSFALPIFILGEPYARVVGPLWKLFGNWIFG